MTTYSLYHPRMSNPARRGDAFSVVFELIGEKVQITDFVKGGIGGMFYIEIAREYYKKKLEEGYTK
jgi:hypothetical protein